MEIKIRDLDVSIEKTAIVHGVNANIGPGEFVGIIGPNGSGKSTLLKAIYRVLQPRAGQIFFDETPLAGLSLKESARTLGVMTQASHFSFDFSVQEVVMMGRAPHKKALEPDYGADFEIVHSTLRQVGMDDLAERKFNTLSGGERQRVLIARALTTQPAALILDEPTNHLDIHYQISLLDIVQGLDIGVFAAMHDLNLAAAYCTKLYVIQAGRIVAFGTPKDVLTQELLREVFRVTTAIHEDPVTGRISIVFTGI